MQATAKKLREADPKKWTQERLAQVFGVSQRAVAYWEAEWTTMHNRSASNVQQAPQKPDSRVKLSTEAKAQAGARVKAGETQAQVAADYGVDQAAVSRTGRLNGVCVIPDPVMCTKPGERHVTGCHMGGEIHLTCTPVHVRMHSRVQFGAATLAGVRSRMWDVFEEI